MSRRLDLSVPDFNSRDQMPDAEKYIRESVRELCTYAGAPDKIEGLTEKLINSYRAHFGLVFGQPTQYTESGRILTPAIGEIVVKPESQLIGIDNFNEAQEHLKTGNVLLIQNHTSIADMLVLETLVRREFADSTTDDWSYISGGPVNDLTTLQGSSISSGFRRFTVNSTSEMDKMTEEQKKEAERENKKAMIALVRFSQEIGKLVVLYPEGTRNDGKMLRARAKSFGIPSAMMRGNENLVVLPSYVKGANHILPTNREYGSDEHSNELNRCVPNQASVTFGKMINILDIIKFSENLTVIETCIENGIVEQGDLNDEKYKKLAAATIATDIMGGSIAHLNPEGEENGYYGSPSQKELMKSFFESLKS